MTVLTVLILHIINTIIIMILSHYITFKNKHNIAFFNVMLYVYGMLFITFTLYMTGQISLK